MGRSSHLSSGETDVKDINTRNLDDVDSSEIIPKKVDLFRDTPIRYLGYANEVGEAFRSQVCGNVVRFTYFIASGYVCADAISKGQEASQHKWADDWTRGTQVSYAVMDTLIWQGLASVIIPGFTINRLCYVSNRLLSHVKRLPEPARKWTVTLLGLGAIPFIIKPIDNSVDCVMERTLRKWFGARHVLEDDVMRHKRNK